MRKVKSLAAVILAAIMMVGSVMPASAAVTYERKYDDGSVYYRTDNAEKYSNYPVWVWWQGYCYYYDSPTNYLKNCTTPDGYTVDEFGRWTENGVAVHNGFGSVKVGTDEYLGKSSNEIWSLMRGKVKNVFAYAITPCVTNDQYAYGYSDDIVWHEFDARLSGRGETYIQHNNIGYNTFVTANMGHAWSDQGENGVDSMLMATYAAKPDMKEKVIKAVVGDNIGQELFNYINNHANKRASGKVFAIDVNGNHVKGRWTFDMDNNGNVTQRFIEDPTGSAYKMIDSNYYGDGINSDALDLSAWQNRTTDYGKRFSVVNNNGALMIHVYN